jgi:glycosyltransferase involved in cell wall biosynthesis
MSSITGIILTHNEQQNIEACIESLRWVDSILVFDSFSDDETVALATGAGATVVQHMFEDYARQRNSAMDAASTDWILFVDADERISRELAAEVRVSIDKRERGWEIPRHNYIFGKLTLWAGWFPDYQLRLLHRASASYDLQRPVHEQVILTGDQGKLVNPIIHYNYRDVAQFVAKQERYADIEARERIRRGQYPRFRTFVTMPLREFWRRFVVERGYKMGYHGLRLSVLMAYYEFQTWVRVRRMARSRHQVET